MKIDFKDNKIIINNETINLTKTESDILKLLYENKNKVVKYKNISETIYEIDMHTELRSTITQHVSNLNKKIYKYIKIRSINKLGYILLIDEKEEF